MKSLRLDAGMAARLQRYGYSIEELAEMQDIEDAIKEILNLPGVSNDPVTRQAIEEIVKGLFGYERSDIQAAAQGTGGDGHNRRANVSNGSRRTGGRKTESLPDIARYEQRVQ